MHRHLLALLASPGSLIQLASRLSPLRLIDRIPWLAGFSASHPTLAKLALYWLVTAFSTFLIVFVQGAPTQVAAVVPGAFPQVFQALGLLVVTSLAVGPIYAPVWFGLLLVSKLGPASGWLILIVVAFIAWKVFMLWINLPTLGLRRDGRQHARLQGRLSDAEVLHRFRATGKSTNVGGVYVVTGMIPLGYIKGQPIGLPWTGDSGHIAVVGPTRSGKGLHLTDTLIRWPGPLVCVDPKGEQWERTAGFRKEAYGPVFRIPPQGLDLANFFDFTKDLDVRELHGTLLRPWQDGKDRIFADKVMPLFTAAAKYGDSVGEHPLAVLARWAQDSPVNALQQAAAIAPTPVQVFTDGVEPERIMQNRFALSSWGNFSTRFSPFAAHLSTITSTDLPRTWGAG